MSARSADDDERAGRVLAGIVEEVARGSARAGAGRSRRSRGRPAARARRPDGGRRRRRGSSRLRSTGWIRTSSPAASNRDSSIRSSTRTRIRPTSCTDELARPAGLRRQRIEMVAEDRDLGDEGRDRRPQLVADIGDEPPVLGVRRLEAEDRLLERADHLVELQRPRTELVVGGHGHPRGEVAAAIRPAARAAASTGAKTPRATSRATITPDDHDRDRAGDQREPELAERLVDRARRRG